MPVKSDQCLDGDHVGCPKHLAELSGLPYACDCPCHPDPDDGGPVPALVPAPQPAPVLSATAELIGSR